MFAFPFLRHTGAGFGGGGQDGRHRLAPSLKRQQNRTHQQTVRTGRQQQDLSQPVEL